MSCLVVPPLDRGSKLVLPLVHSTPSTSHFASDPFCHSSPDQGQRVTISHLLIARLQFPTPRPLLACVLHSGTYIHTPVPLSLRLRHGKPLARQRPSALLRFICRNPRCFNSSWFFYTYLIFCFASYSRYNKQSYKSPCFCAVHRT